MQKKCGRANWFDHDFFVKQRFYLLAVSDITHYVLALFRTQVLRIIHGLR